jgi:hypothetical protein
MDVEIALRRRVKVDSAVLLHLAPLAWWLVAFRL